MKRTLVYVAMLTIGILAYAQDHQKPVFIDSVDLGITNDFPIGDYSTVSAYNLGAPARLNLGMELYANVKPFIQVDNNYWVVKPSWVTFGTQINTLLGLSYLHQLKPIRGLGILSLGGSLGYGMMFHLASADTTGGGATGFSFFDQTVLVELDANLQLDNWPVSIFLDPRFYFAPEQNHQKFQAGAAIGVRIPLNLHF